MKLIATRQGRTDKLDQLLCVRRDGSVTGCAMPRQGILPHDLIHYVVESTLGWRHAFFGMVAAGAGRRLFEAVLALDARWRQVPWHGMFALELPL